MFHWTHRNLNFCSHHPEAPAYCLRSGEKGALRSQMVTVSAFKTPDTLGEFQVDMRRGPRACFVQ